MICCGYVSDGMNLLFGCSAGTGKAFQHELV